MEYRTLRNETEVMNLVQTSLNSMETEKSFEDNYEVMLRHFYSVKKLRNLRPN
jgi:hypothetical protein